jgi:hypothetical protein
LNGINSFKDYGNIYEENLNIKDLLDSVAYKQAGTVIKKETSVCNECEFRYMCTDPRVPYRGSKKWFHKIECTYNPFISKWKYEDGYKTLGEVGVIIDNISGIVSIDEKKTKNL